MHAHSGIAENFVGILRTEERASLRKIAGIVTMFLFLGLFTALMVDLPDGRMLGIGVGTVTLTFLIGGAAGLLYGRYVTTRTWRDSLTQRWNGWMRYSLACARIDEVHRRVQGRPATRSIGPLVAFWSSALFLTLILGLLTVVDGGPALLKTPVFATYGAWLGFSLGRALSVRLWVHDFLVSIDDLMRKGEVGLWGYI
ncbi:MAG: hypothetical protein KY455_00440 [Euryarchaeota archaeon]|nr:hypothetical protein [Euryarchaeota archaeon]